MNAGRWFLKRQQRSIGVSDEELIHIAVKSMGLDELGPFDPKKKIIEYLLEDMDANPLIQMNLKKFADLTASESMAPGGGSVSAYVSSLGIGLGTMVANLSSHKRGWDDKWSYFSDWAEVGQTIMKELILLVDKDTDAFNGIIDAFRLPKNTDEEKMIRSAAVLAATKNAIDIPMQVMKTSYLAFDLLEDMVKNGNPNSITDAGVGALCVSTGIKGAALNAKVNCQGLKDQAYVQEVFQEVDAILQKATEREQQILEIVTTKMISS